MKAYWLLFRMWLPTGVKFDLFGLAFTSTSWYLSVFTLKLWRSNHLFFISHDPLGWRFYLLFIGFNARYQAAVELEMWRLKNGGQIPTKEELAQVQESMRRKGMPFSKRVSEMRKG